MYEEAGIPHRACERRSSRTRRTAAVPAPRRRARRRARRSECLPKNTVEQRVPYCGLTIRSPGEHAEERLDRRAPDGAHLRSAPSLGSTSGESRSRLPSAVDAGLQAPRLAVAVRHPPELVTIAREQVEAAVGRRLLGTRLDVARRGRHRCRGTCRPARPRDSAARGSRRAAVVGHRGRTCRCARRPSRCRLPRGRARRGSRAGRCQNAAGAAGRRVELVAVRGDHERMPGPGPARRKDQAHTKRSSLRWHAELRALASRAAPRTPPRPSRSS